MFTTLLHNATKRIVDIFASILGLILLFPVFLVIAFLIKRESPGPVFYGGKRASKGNKTFLIWKFRTMYEAPESYKGPAVTAKADSRITPFGQWLRDTKINELPQLWNVLAGEMSIVGPRPEDWNIVQTWDKEARAEILSVRPGITSPASVIYHNEEKMLEGEDFMVRYYQHILPDKMRLDRLYVRHHSMLGDIDIILWTLATLLPRIASNRIKEGNLFGGPISRFVRFNISWFLADFLIAFFAVTLVGILWRTTGPIDLGVPKAILFALGISLLFGALNAVFGLNKVVWSRAAPEDMFGIILSSGIVTFIASSVNLISSQPVLPTPMLLLIGLVAIIGFVAARYRWRLLSGLSNFGGLRRNTFSVGERVLIAGAGEESEFTNWLLQRGNFRYAFSVIGVADDDPRKQGMRIDGNWIIGTLADIPHLAARHDIGLIIMAVSNMKKEEHDKVMNACINTGARLLLISDMMSAMQFWLTKSGKSDAPIKNNSKSVLAE
ncbi:MAG: sugar transferase [Anaerolineales bacterium]|nr:sugar transferase [Anaerolineales bacterium]